MARAAVCLTYAKCDPSDFKRIFDTREDFLKDKEILSR